MNLYLCPMPSLAQLPHMHYGLTFGSLHQCYWQNAHEIDFLKLVKPLAEWLHDHEHQINDPQTSFLKATKWLTDSKPAIPKLGPKDYTTTFITDAIAINVIFCLQDPARQHIQAMAREHLLSAFKNNPQCSTLWTIIACSNLTTIGNASKKNRMGFDIDTTTTLT